MSHLWSFHGYLLPSIKPNLGLDLVQWSQYNQLVLRRTYTYTKDCVFIPSATNMKHFHETHKCRDNASVQD